MAEEGNPFVGVLYAGFMLTTTPITTTTTTTTATTKATDTTTAGDVNQPNTEIKIGTPLLLEYNCRFGDPETQVLVRKVCILYVYAGMATKGCKLSYNWCSCGLTFTFNIDKCI